jgi:hypothetical protein
MVSRAQKRLTEETRGRFYRASERKLRLFAAAVAREGYASHHLDVAFRYADGDAAREELAAARAAVRLHRSSQHWPGYTREDDPLDGVEAALGESALSAACDLAESAFVWPTVKLSLLEEIFGPTSVPSIAREWLEWNNGSVRQLAQAIYTEERWQDMLILADCLQEAGCDNEAILRHCRQTFAERLEAAGWTDRTVLQGSGNQRPWHRKGCWLLDRILGRA